MIRDVIRQIPGVRWAAHRFRTAKAKRELRRFAIAASTLRPELPVSLRDSFFYLSDKTSTTPFDPHYLYHTSWAARQLRSINPKEHVDISSSLYFVGLASAIVPIKHLDYRPPDFHIDGVTCAAGDLMNLPFPDNSIESLSCMHVIEHIGLGRYGDPLDPCGDQKAAAELQRVLAPGGQFLFVTPVGRPRVCFNAHRIYSFEMVKKLFPGLVLAQWALVSDDAAGGLVSDPDAAVVNAQSYGCGCFRFSKPG
jgi:SAM-dependent methyltransferase